MALLGGDAKAPQPAQGLGTPWHTAGVGLRGVVLEVWMWHQVTRRGPYQNGGKLWTVEFQQVHR